MQIKIWRGFAKRGPNSTKRPSDSDAVTINVRLKEDTSIESPVFLLSGEHLDANYAAAFGHYYFIDNIVLGTEGLYEIHCTQDRMATYKNNILGSVQFVTRSHSLHDQYIPDDMIVPTSDCEYTNVTLENFFESNMSTGTWVLKTMGDSTPGGGDASTTLFHTYVMNDTMLSTFAAELQDPSKWTDIIGQFFKNPFEAIISLTWLPMNFNNVVNAMPAIVTSRIRIGKYLATATAYPLKRNIFTLEKEGVASIPKYDTQWLNSSSFANCKCIIPYVGSYSINMDQLIDLPKIGIKLEYDIINGSVSFTISGGYIDENNRYQARVFLAEGSGQIGVQLPITASDNYIRDTLMVAPTVVGGLTSLATGNVVGALSSATDSVLAFAHNRELSTGTFSGSFSNRLYGNNVVLNFQQYLPNVQPDQVTDRFGRPLYKRIQLSELSGFCKCMNASLPIPALGKDVPEIESIMNSGFYIE